MVFRKLFGGGGKEKLPDDLDIDDLIVLERYEEAEARLRAKLGANSNDLHSHVKLAEVFTALRKVESAVQEYLFAADEYADDGFYEKGIALLAKAAKLAPTEPSINQRLEQYEELKRIEQARTMAIDGLMSKRRDSGERPSVLFAQQVWLDLHPSALVKRLNADQLRRLFAALVFVKPANGEAVATRGSREEALFIVMRGEVEAVLERPGKRLVLRTFGVGDVLGESTLFEHLPWPATYYAGSSCSLLKLDKDGLEQALLGNADPKGLLDALRSARADRDVAAAMEKFG